MYHSARQDSLHVFSVGLEGSGHCDLGDDPLFVVVPRHSFHGLVALLKINVKMYLAW